MPALYPWINRREGLGNKRRYQEARFGRPLLLSNERRALLGINPRHPTTPGTTLYDTNLFDKFSTYRLSLNADGYMFGTLLFPAPT